MKMHATPPTNRITYKQDGLSEAFLLQAYEAILRPRLFEEKMLILLRQGKISKWFSGIGQEAVAVGSTLAMPPSAYILPMHRNLGVFTTRKVPLRKLMAQFQGKAAGFTQGRDRSFHFGSPSHHLVGMISHLGAQLSVADGIALAHKLQGEQQVVLAFCGDGATSEGEFHEALNVAAVWQLPVIFIIENNGYGLSTPNHEQFRCKFLAEKAPGYGMESQTIEGNNLPEVYRTIKKWREQLEARPRPVLIEAMTFRMRGHEEASGTKYVPKALMEQWEAMDPVINFEEWLMGEHLLSAAQKAEIRQRLKAEIDTEVKAAFSLPAIVPNAEKELREVYAPAPAPSPRTLPEVGQEMRLVDAISDGLKTAMEIHPNLVLMGQDIAEYGGVFKITEGFTEQFGNERVRNTPLCESAILGAALGLSVKGMKAMVEMQFADFVSCGFNQIVNNLAKVHYRWGQHADVVIRMPTGGSVAAGPFHSQSNEAWFTHTPGLKVVYPSNPQAAKGLLLAAFEDPNPVLFFEHKALYRKITGWVPHGEYTLPIGQAATVQAGTAISLITYGLGVHWAAEAAKNFPKGSVEILDLQSLLPWDREAVAQSVRKTGKVLVCHEDCLTGGIGGEIAAWIAEHCFEQLDAPVMREGSLDTPVPFASALEQQFLPQQRIAEKMQALWDY